MNKAQQSDSDRPTRVKGRRSFIALAFITLLLATVAVGCQMYWREIGESMPKFDLSMVNALTVLICLFVAFLWWLWLIIKGPNFFWSRVVPALMAIVVVAASFLVELVFDGNAGFVGFRWRFERRAPPLRLADDTFVNLRLGTDDAFTQFLGPHRNAIIPDVYLDRDWDNHPPKQIWKTQIGTGASGFVATRQFAITLEQRDELEMVTCYQMTTGRVVWAYAIANRHFTSLGKEGPRSTPVIHNGQVFAVTANGKLMCIDGATIRTDDSPPIKPGEDNKEKDDKDKEADLNNDGVVSDVEAELARINRGEPEWIKDIPDILDIKVEREEQLVGLPYDVERSNLNWGRAGSPLIYKNLVIVPGGGVGGGSHTSLLGFDLKTGDLKWKAGDRPISYSSPNFVTLAGVPQIVVINESTANGYDPETGKELWNHPRPGASNGDANTSQVTVVSGNQVLLTKGYGLGAELVELTPKNDGTLEAKSVWKDTRKLKTKFCIPVVKDGYAYGLSDGILECIDVQTGDRMWKKGRFGNGQLLLIGDDLVVVEERSGTIKLIEAAPEAYIEHGVYKNAIRGICWNTLCFVDDKLLIRSDEEAICLQLKLKQADDNQE